MTYSTIWTLKCSAGTFEDPFENEPGPLPPPVPGMPNAGHQPMQHPEAAAQKATKPKY